VTILHSCSCLGHQELKNRASDGQGSSYGRRRPRSGGELRAPATEVREQAATITESGKGKNELKQTDGDAPTF
jgi:hypothetical protein